MRLNKRFITMKRFYSIASALACWVVCFYPEKPSYAAAPAENFTVTCYPGQPVAHAGEKIAVTAWIHGPSEKDTVEVKWTPSIGTIAGTRMATWSFPNDDAKISIEAPAKAKVIARHRTLGESQCDVYVFFVRPVGTRGENKIPERLLSGRTFLLSGKKEPEGYGLYSYFLLGSPPANDVERERYIKGIESYLQVIQPIEELERYRDSEDLNITLIPLKATKDLNRNVTDPKQVRELAVKLLDIYDYARAQVLLAEFGRDATSSGPFLVAKRGPTGAKQTAREVFDMTGVSPRLVAFGTKTFCSLATQELSWTESTLRRLAFHVRNVIAIAAKGIP